MTRVLLATAAVVLLTSCASNRPPAGEPDGPTPILYVVDLNDRADDLFHVTMSADLGPENEYYQFASTAPGTYQVMDIGRFVRSFEAYDASGNPVPTERTSVNRWQFSRPDDVALIRYSIAETWDTPVDEHPVYMMAGSSIEQDHVFINGQTVFGFPAGMQATPLEIRLDYPASWTVGTALEQGEDGLFYAEDYDYVVDSPILTGMLSFAELDVSGTDVEVYTYSKTGHVTSEKILDAVRDILFASDAFLGSLPVDRYAFLFHFEDLSMGAWEHSFSSAYVYAEDTFDQAIQEGIPSVVAHEFFHIVTPLNIHSEIIQEFNFSEPVPSQHLWLYEGTTEWASDMLQLRAGLIDLDNYLGRLQMKHQVDDQFDPTYSLARLALTSYADEGQRQYPNIYNRGALVAGLLDIRLLELSGGTRGLREVLVDLSARYGPDRPFDEEGFFEDFAEMTYPEIAGFFDSYVKNASPLPTREYFAKLGIAYEPERETGEMETSAGLHIGVPEGKIVIMKVAEEVSECGFRPGDELVGFDGKEVTLATIQKLAVEWNQIPADVPYELTVRRDGADMTIQCQKYARPKIDRHIFSPDPEAAPQQIRLREIWMRNLPLES